MSRSTGYYGTKNLTGFEDDVPSDYEGGSGRHRKYTRAQLGGMFGGLEGGVEGGAEGGAIIHDLNNNRKTSAIIEGVVIVTLLFLMLMTFVTGSGWVTLVACVVVCVYLAVDYCYDKPGGWIETRNQAGHGLPWISTTH